MKIIYIIILNKITIIFKKTSKKYEKKFKNLLKLIYSFIFLNNFINIESIILIIVINFYTKIKDIFLFFIKKHKFINKFIIIIIAII